jgi:alpha-tubulin suppressor-like RCC1 family protein
MWCWGSNEFGQLGDGTTNDLLTPNQVGTLTHWEKISCGGYYNMASTDQDKLWSWGKNDKGQLGNWSLTQTNTPDDIATSLN